MKLPPESQFAPTGLCGVAERFAASGKPGNSEREKGVFVKDGRKDNEGNSY
jgi:hypothetical protein